MQHLPTDRRIAVAAVLYVQWAFGETLEPNGLLLPLPKRLCIRAPERPIGLLGVISPHAPDVCERRHCR